MVKKIIFLAGYSCSGKDTVADYLVKHKGYRKFAFADSLKQLCAMKYHFDITKCYHQAGKKEMITIQMPEESQKLGAPKIMEFSVRDILINEAQFQRKRNPNIFVEELVKRLSTCTNEHIVISDFRYLNEYYYFKRNGKFEINTIRINRDSIVPMKDPSEHQLQDFSFGYQIENNSTLSQLYEKIEALEIFN